MTDPPPAADRLTRSFDRVLPDEPRRRAAIGVAGIVASLVAGTYGLNFVLGPLNLGALELVWGALLALGGVGGLLGSAAIVASAVPPTLATGGTDDGSASTPDGDPVATLERRYAEGAIDEAEFERRLERVLTGDDGDRTGADGAATDRDRERDPAYDR